MKEELKDTIVSWLRQWFDTNSNIAIKDSEDFESLNYFSAGLIDSIEFPRFIIDIEEEFNIRFEYDDFSKHEFSTIYGLYDTIKKRIHSTS